MSDDMVRGYLQRDTATTASLLVNPFTRLSGGPALGVGLAIVAATVAVAVLGRVHYDGAMDVHVGAPAPMWLFGVQPVIDWLVVAVLFWLGGRIYGSGARRVVDYFGMSAVGRLPFVLAGVLWAEPVLGRFIAPLAHMGVDLRIPDLAALPGSPWIIVGGVVTMAVMAWGLFLNYFALREASGMKTNRAIPVYIGVIIAAEIITKVLIWLPLFLGLAAHDMVNVLEYGSP